MTNVACIILAAGNSGRMGRPKPFLRFNDEMNFIEKIVTAYQKAAISEIVVVINENINHVLQINPSVLLKDCRFIVNHHPEYERFYSVKMGLNACGKTDHAFIQNADNPFIDDHILRHMISAIDDADYYVPFYKDRGGHPILISELVMKELISCKQNDLNLKDWLSNYTCKQVVVDDDRVLININTPAAYHRYFF